MSQMPRSFVQSGFSTQQAVESTAEEPQQSQDESTPTETESGAQDGSQEPAGEQEVKATARKRSSSTK